MAKIQLVKETKLSTDGLEYRYSIEVDGKYVGGSITSHLSVAERYFEQVKNGETNLAAKQVLKEVIIND